MKLANLDGRAVIVTDFGVVDIAKASELYPCGLIFSGTPAGVGFSRTPPRYLATGNILSSFIEGLGELRNPCVDARQPPGLLGS